MLRPVKDIDAGIPLTELVSNVPMVQVTETFQVKAVNVDVIQLIFAMKRTPKIVIQKLKVQNYS